MPAPVKTASKRIAGSDLRLAKATDNSYNTGAPRPKRHHGGIV